MQLNRPRISIVLLTVAVMSNSGASAKSNSATDKPASHGAAAPSKPVAAPAKPGAAPAPPAQTAPAASQTLPDYGGRESASTASFEGAAGTDAPSPAGQAWRAFEALVIVLAMVFGGLYLLKRFGVMEGGRFLNKGGAAHSSAAARRFASKASPGGGAIQLVGTQPLPGSPGACVHLLTIEGRSFLVGATSQSVTLISEWENGDSEPDAEVTPRAFREYLTRQGEPAPTPFEEDIALARVSESNDRLRDLLSRVRGEQAEISTGKSEA